MAPWHLQRRILSLFSTTRPHTSLSKGFSDILKGQARLHGNAVPQLIGNFSTKLGCTKMKGNLCPPALSFRSFIHSLGPNEFEPGRNTTSNEFEPGRNSTSNEFETGRNMRSNEFETGRNFRSNDFETGRNFRSNEFQTGRNFRPNEFQSGRNFGSNEFQPGRNFRSNELDTGRNNRSMNFMRGIIEGNGRDVMGGPEQRYGVENNADIVHVKLIRNNTFVTLTDSKGNKKAGASSGCLAEMKGGPKVSRYAAEATAEHVGRLVRNMGLKSVVMKVNGFTFFKKKKQAILSFREGYTHSRGDQNPIIYIEDTTRKPHNGCRLRKKRRV